MSYTWGTELSVGWVGIDEEHRQVLRRLAEVEERIEAGDSPGTGAALSALADAVLRHFVAEEELMDRWLYPERAAHKGAHDLFIQDLLALVQEQAEAGLTDDVVEWARGRMPEWLSFHIETNDAPLGRYLAARQGRPRQGPEPPQRPPES
jgi:hemerythrin-like metal-binding protein